MNTIDALENDIFLQIPFLQQITFPKQQSLSKQHKIIFCGSGDSLAAAYLSEAFSNFNVRAADPLDLLKNSSILKTNELKIISISGNTISNIKVAKISKNTTAITANKKSKLAKACKKIILLDYPSSGVFTSGSIGFLASALTCISLVSKVKIKNVLKLFNQALDESKKIRIGKKIFIIGNLQTYPIAMYGAAKLYEILGANASYERIEQFLHMGIFSIKKGDTVIIFEKKNQHNTRLIKNLKKLGINAYRPNSPFKDKISQFLFFTFFSQLVPLFFAKKNNQKECFFVTSKKLRNVSSNMIY